MRSNFLAVCAAVLVVAGGAQPARAQGENPKIAGLYRDSYALEAKGDFKGALDKVRDARAAGAQPYFSTVRVAWLAYLAGEYALSAATYGEAVVLEPKAIEPKLGRTLPLLALRNWRDLERACRDVLALEPQNALARARLAQASYWTGNYPDAATTYQKLTDEYPSNLDYQTGLGWALLKQGRTADARRVFQMVLTVSPDNASAREGLAVR